MHTHVEGKYYVDNMPIKIKQFNAPPSQDCKPACWILELVQNPSVQN